MSKEVPLTNMPPLDWVVQHAGQIAAPGHVLDVACGRGGTLDISLVWDTE